MEAAKALKHEPWPHHQPFTAPLKLAFQISLHHPLPPSSSGCRVTYTGKALDRLCTGRDLASISHGTGMVLWPRMVFMKRRQRGAPQRLRKTWHFWDFHCDANRKWSEQSQADTPEGSGRPASQVKDMADWRHLLSSERSGKPAKHHTGEATEELPVGQGTLGGWRGCGSPSGR